MTKAETPRDEIQRRLDAPEEPLAYDLFCGLGGWAEGFLAEGYRVVGFDIERRPYPGQLVLQDVLTIHGSQLRDASVIVASPPCQAYSYRAMPWKRAKALPPPDNALFEACFRIQREANEAIRNHCVNCGTFMLSHHRWCGCNCTDFVRGDRYIPLIVENVRGAVPWVGPAKGKYGSYYLWGDVPALMPTGLKLKGSGGTWFHENRAVAGGIRSPRDSARIQETAERSKIPFPLAQHIARTFKP